MVVFDQRGGSQKKSDFYSAGAVQNNEQFVVNVANQQKLASVSNAQALKPKLSGLSQANPLAINKVLPIQLSTTSKHRNLNQLSQTPIMGNMSLGKNQFVMGTSAGPLTPGNNVASERY